MTNHATPSSSTQFLTDTLRLATALAAEEFPFEARRVAPGSGGAKANVAYFVFPATPELLDTVRRYYEGQLRLNPTAYEEARTRIFAAVNVVLGRSGK